MDHHAKSTGEWEYFQNLKNDWNVLQVQLKEQFNLTDDDLKYEEGKEDQLLKRLETKLNKSREEVERLLQDIYLSEPKAGSVNHETKNKT